MVEANCLASTRRDKRAMQRPPRHEPAMSTEFALVRHGQTELNRAGRIQGHLDSALIPEGIAQAVAASPHKVAIPNVAINRVAFADGAWTIQTWGDVAHIEPETLEPV
jgi:broad specificity phosphatase PhoE